MSQAWSCALSPNGRLLATGSDDGEVCVANVEGATIEYKFVHEGRLYEAKGRQGFQKCVRPRQLGSPMTVLAVDHKRTAQITGIAWLPGSSDDSRAEFVAVTRDFALIRVTRNADGQWRHIVHSKLDDIVEMEERYKNGSVRHCCLACPAVA